MSRREEGGPRLLAAQALFACFRQGAYGDAVLKKHLASAQLEAKDAALASAIFYGVLQNRMLLLFYIAQYSSLKIRKIHPFLLELICTGAYQILFMDRIPHSAAVNETVKLAKLTGNARAAGYVNALLRALSAASDNLPEPPGSGAGYLSVKYSHPQWIVEEFLETYGEVETSALLKANNSAPCITARVNTVRGSVDEAVRELMDEGVQSYPHAVVPGCLSLHSSGDIGKLCAYTKGFITVQDPAAMLCVFAASPEPGTQVLDLCAAPGGKSMLAAELMHNKGRIVSCDIHPDKVKIIQKNSERTGLSIIRPELSDAAVLKSTFVSSFDLVMADVPCSGFGIIRKKPDIRYKDAQAVRELCDLQLRILKNAAEYVRPGGRLCYFTCTLRKSENEQVVSRFLSKHSDYKTEDFKVFGYASKQGMLQTLPHRDDMDGFFICRMKRSI